MTTVLSATTGLAVCSGVELGDTSGCGGCVQAANNDATKPMIPMRNNVFNKNLQE